MTVPTIFETCRPRSDVLAGVADADFAADLAQVITGTGSAEYHDPVRFFAATYPTRGLRNLLGNVCARLSRAGGDVASIFRLDTSYGGGKTHGLIALVHAAGGLEGVANPGEFVDPAVLPEEPVRVAAFDGENADPANGRTMEEGLRAFTPWGEIAYALAGYAGYERVRESDRRGIAPGADTLRELFDGRPALVLLDELSVYLRKVQEAEGAGDQLTAFLTSLFKAVESTPNVALVYTLAVGKDGRGKDAYSQENTFIADRMAEAEKVSARKATLLNPTEQDETIHVLRRRLFEDGGERTAEVAEAVASAYAKLWKVHNDALAPDASRPETRQLLAAGYPFHPEVLETLTDKTATLETFQRVRGMLRLLARTIHYLWKTQPEDATAIHLHHIDPGHEPIRQEIVTRLDQSRYDPALNADVSSGKADKKSLAQQIDAENHGGLPPFAEYVARTIFLHSLAYNEPLKGLAPNELRYSMIGPALDVSFVDEASKKFVGESAYLDDRPGAPMRFLAEANLTQIVRREERNVDPEEARVELNDRIRTVFEGNVLEAVCFPGGPHDVPDEAGESRPKLVVVSYDAVSFEGTVDHIPDLVDRIYSRKGADGQALRLFRNNVVFAVADESLREDMRAQARRLLALRELKKPDRLDDLAEHQQAKVREWAGLSEMELAVSIQQCYRHVVYPSRNRIEGSPVDLAHTALDRASPSDRPGAGQKQVVRALQDLTKLRLPGDEPDSPAYVRDRTPLRKGQMTTRALRDEFRRAPELPILVSDDVFVRGVTEGVKQGEYVYRSGDLLYGPGDPQATIRIDEQSVVLTMAYAKSAGVWPRAGAGEPKADGKADGSGQGVLPVKPADDDAPAAQSTPASGRFEAEGPFREAMVRVWEQARAKGAEKIETLDIRLFDADEGLRLVALVEGLPGTTKSVSLEGGYETASGGSLDLDYQGPPDDAGPVREFLQSQFRAASGRTLETGCKLTFEDGLATKGDAPEQLTARLARFVSGEAVVTATEMP